MYLKNKMFNKSLINKRIILSNHKLLNGRVLVSTTIFQAANIVVKID